MTLAEFVDRMCEEARARLHAAIDVRTATERARRIVSYPRRLGQLYRRKP